MRFLIDRERPVAVLRGDDSERVVTWPDAPLPARASTARLVAAPDAVWVVYEAYVPDSAGLVWSTAVRIGADGSAVGVDIGRLSVIGADSEGIWASPAPWPAPEPYPGDGDVEEPASFDSEDLPVESWEDFQKDEDDWRMGELSRHRDGRVDGVYTLSQLAELGDEDEGEHSYGWFASAPGSDPGEAATRLAPPPAPGPSAPVELVRFGGDGRVDPLTVDRTVAEVAQDGSRTVFTFFPTNPVGTLDQETDSISYSYPQSRISVDLTDGVPSALTVGDHEAAAVPADDEECWDDDTAGEAAEPDARDLVDLATVSGIDWAPAQLSADDIQAAVRDVVEQLEWLARPNTIWTRRDDRIHRVESPYRDLAVRASGDWPETQVTVEFRHREYADALYRRRYRIFDPAGRPIDREYLTVYLEEDIATGHHPAARDGVIEFPDE